MGGEGGPSRRWPRLAAGAVALAIACAVGAPGGTVLAHAIVEESLPADGTLLATAPTELRVRFSEPISGEFIEVQFLTATSPVGSAVAGTLDPGDPTVLVVPLPALDDGLYQVGFVVRDREDLHEVRGRTSFAIGDHAAVAPSAPPAPAGQPFEAVARWLFALGLALLVGVVVVRARWLEVPVAHPRRLTWLAIAALVAVLAGRIGVVTARAYALHAGLWDGLSAVARTSDVARLPVVLAAAGCAMPLLVPRRFASLDAPVLAGRSLTVRLALGWMGIVWLAIVAAWGDHAALRGAVEPGVALAKAGHLVGLGVWLGVLGVTIVVNAGSGRVMAALHASSRVAVLGALLTVTSGLVLASRTVVSLTGLFATAFGELLVVKVAAIAVAAGLGLAHRRGRPAVASAELVVLVAVVLAGSLMATAGPATDDAYLAAPERSAPGVVNGQTSEVIVRLRAVPAQPGPNDIELSVVETRRPAPAPVTAVTVTAQTPAGARSWTVVPDERGNAVIPGVSLGDGSTPVSVSVARSALPPEDVDLALSTRAPAYHHPVIASSAPIRTPLLMLAVAVALAAAVVVMTWSRRPLGSSRLERNRSTVA
ncbi:MAG: copper resistance protein CopC [Actinobacteria bacterium]|nr:copper resistance protein CopC [Actinomycetota bacterium]